MKGGVAKGERRVHRYSGAALCHGVERSLEVVSIRMLVAPHYVPARMGLQASSEQIPGQCRPEEKEAGMLRLCLASFFPALC